MARRKKPPQSKPAAETSPELNPEAAEDATQPDPTGEGTPNPETEVEPAEDAESSEPAQPSEPADELPTVPDEAPPPATDKAPELAMSPPPDELEFGEDLVVSRAESPPSADEMFDGAPSVKDLMSTGYTATQADLIHKAFLDMVQKVREILSPALVAEESVQIRSSAQQGHYRLGQKWSTSPVLFAPDDPFLSDENVKVLKDDPRIKIVFPKTPEVEEVKDDE